MENEPTKENKWQEPPPAKPATSGRKTGSPAASPESDRPPLGDLGFTRIPAAEDPRRNPELLAAIAKVAPGTELRQAVDDVIRSHEGALIVVGDPNGLAFLYSGGMQLDAPFRSQLLYELAKMDGAIIVDEAIKRLAWANVQLMPDPTIPSDETGTRHRTAERVAKQTGALVVSVSQQRETVTIFVGPARYQLDPVADVLAKTTQALGMLDTYRQRLEQVLTRLTALEFQNAVVLDDVLVVLQRAAMISRMSERITRDCVELGSEGRLIRLQLAELVGDVAGQRDTIVRDYDVAGAGKEATAALAELAGLRYQELLEFGRLAEILGYDRGVNPLDQSVAPRGYRILSHIPRLPELLVHRVVADLGSLDAVVRASQRELESVEGVGAVRAREIREGLRRLQEHNLVDRYLQL
jgi:diadenylate cyclase